MRHASGMWESPVSIALRGDAADSMLNPDLLARSARQRRAELLRLRPGAYVYRSEFESATWRDQHLTRMCAMRLTGDLEPGAILARESAAVLHGIPLIGPMPEKVQLVKIARGGGRLTPTTRTLSARPDCEIEESDGVPLTSLRQTLIDLGRRRSFSSTLVSLDDALRQGTTSKERLLELLAVQRGCRGNSRLRAWIAVADPRSESPGESLSRAVMIEHHLPPPDLQTKIYDRHGVFVGRVDFSWPELKVIGEFDGRMKYDQEVYGRSMDNVLFEERQREQALMRASGMQVVRWLWGDALREGGREMLERLADAGVRSLY